MGILRGAKDEYTVSVMAEVYGEKIHFSATYRRRDWDEANRIASEIRNAMEIDSSDGWARIESVIREDLVSWANLRGEGGDVEYTPDNVDLAMTVLAYRRALWQGWNLVHTQEKGVNTKK